jgi:hypothetical protein
MAQTSSAEEIRERCISSLGPDLGGLHYALWNEIAWLHLKWAQYVTLFGATPQRVELLNRAAPLFIRIIQDTLWDDAILHLTRLTDSPQSMGKANLTIRRYPVLVTDTAWRAELDDAVSRAVSLAEFARDWRNRHLAHRDLRLALGEPTAPLAPASRASMKAALKALSIVYNCVERHAFGETTLFDSFSHPGDAASLLNVIRAGVDARHARLERLRRGEATAEDLRPPPAV